MLPIFPTAFRPRKEKPIAWPLSLVFASILLGNNLFTKISLLLCLVYFAAANVRAVPDIFSSLRHLWSLVLLEIWSIASIAWSVVPSVTLDIVLTQCAFFSLCILMARYAVNRNMAASFRLTAFFVIAVIILYTVAFPGAAFSPYGFKAFYGNKNNLGISLAICIAILLFSRKPRWTDLGMAGLAFSLLVLSQSKTSLIVTGTVAGLAMCAYTYRALSSRIDDYSKGVIEFVGRGTPALAYATIVAGVVFREHIANALIEAIPYDFLTGRGELWVTVLRRTSSDLLRGLGPGSFWSAGPLSEIAQTSLFTKHPGWIENLGAADGGYVDMVGSLGFIGLALLLFSIVGNYRQLTRITDRSTSILLMALITFFSLHNITETTVFLSTNSLWFIYLFASGYLAFCEAETPAETGSAQTLSARIQTTDHSIQPAVRA